jgi:hypothetical protein
VRTDRALAALLAAALCGCAAALTREQPAEALLPTDVVEFFERRVLCEHFLGEEPYDAERREFLIRSIDVTCTGTDRTLQALRQRYRDDPGVAARLAEFEYPLGY